jgi:hypothetical protein
MTDHVTPGISPDLLPERVDGYAVGPVRVNYTRLTSSKGDMPDIWSMTVDTGDARLVTFFTPEGLEATLRNGLRALGVDAPTLTIADMTDLRSIGIDPA